MHQMGLKKPKRPKEMCVKCRREFWMVADKKFIKNFGKCQSCVLEEDLGHPYIKRVSPPTLCKTCKELTKTKNGYCTKCKTLKLYKSEWN
jgi:hypothetical protein